MFRIYPKEIAEDRFEPQETMYMIIVDQIIYVPISPSMVDRLGYPKDRLSYDPKLTQIKKACEMKALKQS
jgi:hypothetical protein